MTFLNIQEIFNQLGLASDLQIKVVKSILAVFLLVLLKIFSSRMISKKVEEVNVAYRWRKILTYSIYFIMIVIVGSIWYSGIHSIATFFGLIGAGLALAFKDYLSNLAAWIYIFWKEPFKVGHRIQVGDAVGDVVDLGPVQISLLEIGNFANSEQPTGRISFIPNSKVFTDKISNYDLSFPYIWHEVDIVVTFESDWRKAKSIINDKIIHNSLVYDEHSLGRFRKESKSFLMPEMILDPKIFTSVADHGIRLTARFVCEPRTRRAIEEKIWEEILDSFFREKSIDFAYPTQRFYSNASEGKVSFMNKEDNKGDICE